MLGRRLQEGSVTELQVQWRGDEYVIIRLLQGHQKGVITLLQGAHHSAQSWGAQPSSPAQEERSKQEDVGSDEAEQADVQGDDGVVGGGIHRQQGTGTN